MKAVIRQIQNCELCPRLRSHCKSIAKEKRKAFMNETYWGKPVTGFGDEDAEVMIIGLAPAAHGANRTGRMFTGDRSGEWLYRALYEHGYANQPNSGSIHDGLKLKNVYVTSVVKCAPPDNKPNTEERDQCLEYLKKEIELLKQVKTVIVLGKFALDGYWALLDTKLKKPKFKHGHVLQLSDSKKLILSYHPSQQNTFTGKLTKPMFDSIFKQTL